MTSQRISFHRQNSDQVSEASSSLTLVEPLVIPSTMDHMSMPTRPASIRRTSSVYSLHDGRKSMVKLLVPDAPVPTSTIISRHASIVPSLHSGFHPTSIHQHNQNHNLVDQVPDQVVYASFVSHLRRPLLPIVHIFLILSHLGLAATTCVLLVTHLIQPLVLWLILIVCLFLQLIYLLPGITLEVIALVRGRPIHSAWLQSGLHLTLSLISVIPAVVTVGLLVLSNQLPKCSSPWYYTPPLFPNFGSYLEGTACEGLPRVLMITMVDAVVIICEIVITASAIGLDHKVRRRNAIQQVTGVNPTELKVPGGLVDGDLDRYIGSSIKLRWTTGVGTLLWELETAFAEKHRRKMSDTGL